MKYVKVLLVFFALSQLSVSCTNDDDAQENELDTNLVGRWQFSVSSGGTGGGTSTETIEDGEIFTFFEDGTFTAKFSDLCTTGSYTNDDERIYFELDCENPPGTEDENGFTVVRYFIGEEMLIMWPEYVTCSEGCSYFYLRLD